LGAKWQANEAELNRLRGIEKPKGALAEKASGPNTMRRFQRRG
jgi:hypothetical protein